MIPISFPTFIMTNLCLLCGQHEIDTQHNICELCFDLAGEFCDDNALLLRAADALLACCKSASATYEDRLSLLEEEKEWRADDEYDDMVAHYTSLKKQVNAAIALATNDALLPG